MKQCLHITICLKEANRDFTSMVQQKARSLRIEGTVQPVGPSKCIIIGCGSREDLDFLIDAIHQMADLEEEKGVIIEPFLKTKDYRGVFRIIE